MLNDDLCALVRVNPSWTPFVRFKGELFEKGRSYAKSEFTIKKGLKKRIQNHILHVLFKRKISVSQSNFLYQKWSICIWWPKMTENVKTRQNAYFEMAPKQEHFFIHTFRSFQCIRFVKKQYFLSQTKGKGGDFRLCPLLDPRPIWLDQTGTLHI